MLRSTQMPARLLLTLHDPVGKPISTSMLRAMFRKATEVAHLLDAGYTPHSLRRGGASFSFNCGVPLENIKKHGTWRSAVVEDYLCGHPLFTSPVIENFTQILTIYSVYSLLLVHTQHLLLALILLSVYYMYCVIL